MSKLLRMYKAFIIIIFSFYVINIFAKSENQNEYRTDSESFAIPGHGELIINVPKIWNYRYKTTNDDKPPIITLYNLDKNKGEIYQLNLSILWEDGFQRNISSPEYIRSLVEQTGKEVLVHSDQTKLKLEKISGRYGVGYFFNLSDSNASSGEYQFLTQGALGVGRLLLIFSLFSNDNDSILQEALMKIIMSAKHQNRKDV